MSQLLKKNSSGDSVGLYFGKSSGLRPLSEEQQLVASQKDEIAALKKEISSLKENVSLARKEGELEGKKKAEVDLTNLHKDSHGKLSLAMHKAEKELAEKIRLVDVLALKISQRALSNIFTDHAIFNTLLLGAIKQEIASLDQKLIVAFRISVEDFNEIGADLENIYQYVRIESDSGLKRGDCQIDLIAGHLEISLERYWIDLQSALVEKTKEYGQTPPASAYKGLSRNAKSSGAPGSSHGGYHEAS